MSSTTTSMIFADWGCQTTRLRMLREICTSALGLSGSLKRMLKSFQPRLSLSWEKRMGTYIIGLEDLIRKHIYSDCYVGDKVITKQQRREDWIRFGDHCIDNLHQTIMCKSNIATIPWIYTERVHANFPPPKTTRICRNFDKLMHHQLPHFLGASIFRFPGNQA
ncbi:hypothetical protein QR685DRAFT_557807 [Neurospora intermedia]|uniref:Uncharacterized protein n=1 Tax=Neurospora intermedia TaxID=5142 RepID=A0ABR3CYH5_NEUIN